MASLVDKDLDLYLEWDVVNWRRALAFLESDLQEGNGRTALEIGGRNGGLSLLLAKYGWQVTCSDLNGPSDKALELHQTAGVTDRIDYSELDILHPQTKERFDLVIFKSVMGGVTSRSDEDRIQMVRNIHGLLEPGGKLLFIENLSGNAIHRWLRKRFVQWGNRWNYLPYVAVPGLLSDFDDVRFESFGLFGLLGRRESHRKLLGRLDALLERIVPPSWRYIIAVSAIKGLGHDPSLPMDDND